MVHPRPPLKALLPARRAADEESLVQASESISDHYPGHPYSRQHLLISLSSLLWGDPSLPTSIGLRAWRPPLRNKIALERQANISRGNRTHTRAPTLLQHKGVSMVNERTKQGAGEGEDVSTSFYELTSHNCDIRSTKHERRIEELKKYLIPMSPEDGSAVVLLCWGEKSCCSILPVSVSNPEDEVATWREINTAWYTCRGHWRKMLLGFKVTRVAIAEITMLGLKEASNRFGKAEYIGMYLENDIPEERRKLQHIIDSELPMTDCFYSRETGTVDCGTLRAARRKLLFLDTLDLMRHVFSNPFLAASNDFLEKGNLVYSHQEVLNQFHFWHDWHCPGLREIRFRGIVIKEGWVLGTQQVILPLTATTFIAVVMAAKFLFDWSTAWNVGSFFVALATLLWMWATYMAR
ncbi:hypothetical protein BDW69DRAFT_197864 [Aspergillus filifer]